jgi:hypothetical protein
MTMLFGGMVVVLYHLPGMQEPSFETDKALLLETRQRLTGVLAEFDALPLPDGVTGEDAEYSTCGTESGGLYQPSAFRELTVPSFGAVPAAVAVAEALQERGWVVSPDTSHGYKIEADRGRWSLTGRVDAAQTGERSGCKRGSMARSLVTSTLSR